MKSTLVIYSFLTERSSLLHKFYDRYFRLDDFFTGPLSLSYNSCYRSALIVRLLYTTFVNYKNELGAMEILLFFGL